jgi:predicted AAA+ superfamily ATPase
VFNALIVRDIIRRYKIRNVNLLNKLVDFLMDIIGNITSVRKISDTLTSNKIKTNDKTVGKYIDYLCNAFAFYRIRRYDISGKRYLTTDDKYYLSDHSFKYARLGTKNLNIGRVIENIVAVELLRRGYEVYVGTLYNGEIDFVAMEQNEKIYFQVADDITNEETFKREVSALLKIKDAYPKILLARTRQKEFQYEGIRIINLADWLVPS